MTARELKLVGCLAAVVGVPLLLAESVVQIGDGWPEYTIRVKGGPDVWVCRAVGMIHSKREPADEALNQKFGPLRVDQFERACRVESPTSFTLVSYSTSRRSTFGLWQNTYAFSRWAVVAVELTDGSQWAGVVELPDPRASKQVALRLDEARRLPDE